MQRMFTAHLIVPVRQDQQRSGTLNSATQKLNHIQRSLICPMQIFKDDDCRSWVFLQVNEELRGDRQAVGAGLNLLQQIRLELQGNVKKRTERLRAEHVVTGAPQHARRLTLPGNEALDQ